MMNDSKSVPHSVSNPPASSLEHPAKFTGKRNMNWRMFPQDRCVHQLFEAQALKTPDALAIADGQRSLTYRELDALSNQLAHLLRALGVGPEKLVALLLGRSASLIVSALGILKAGGAYLPLDPTYPPDRLDAVLRESGSEFLVSRKALADLLPPNQLTLVALDEEASRLASMSTTPLPSEATAKHLAYVIYTSGSTGVPKGVEVTHANLLNLVFWHQQEFGIRFSDRATQFSSPGFDASVWEVWPYLTAGASIHIVDHDSRLSPEALRDWLVAHRITLSFVPTPLAEQLLLLRWPADPPLRILLTGADMLHRYPGFGIPFTLINNYGPTETTVVATSGRIAPEPNPTRPPTIGRPIANTEIYILNEQLQHVRPGEEGELFIGGAGVARGYRNQPQLTAERFLPNPFLSEPAERLYRTGDMARVLPDGQIEFLGRRDQQVKIHGYRIELDEIVSALNSHPAVGACAVTARDDGQGEQRLVAYLVLEKDIRVRAADLRDHLQTTLPDYMIPATYVRLDALPVSSSGKVDRAAMPAPDDSNILRDLATVAPRTSVEKKMATIISNLLGLQQVGLNDDFFLLGGHSLLGMQLVSRVGEQFGVELSLRDLFDQPSIAGISAAVERLLAKKAKDAPLQTGAHKKGAMGVEGHEHAA